jgi:hypothetical protein
VLRIPPRNGIWLFDYQDIKYNSRLQWSLHLIFGGSALVFGSVTLFALLRQAMHGDVEFVPIVMATCALLVGLLYAPAAVIYFFRRNRGEPTDFFDYDVLDRGRQTSNTDGDSDAPDHR